ncbi:MAG: 2'-deoxycytidine 5'-triphosphate deaminase [Maricaulaceae bacterium]|jgi:dCTP deaminase
MGKSAKSAVGILNDAAIAELIEAGQISLARPPDPDQIQPASLDLRLSDVAFRLRASFLPGPGAPVAERLKDPRLIMHKVDLKEGAVLETGCVYLAPLEESLALGPEYAGRANPKSSTGRIDVFTRVISDGAISFDDIPAGYKGPLYAEICPRTFSILARRGDRLGQLRLRRGPEPTKRREITVSVDLSDRFGGLAGFRAKRHSGVIDVSKEARHDPLEYWEPIATRGGGLVLDPGEFYILASKEPVHIPPDEAAEMAPIATEIGEFRAHYAGFFDPGFGDEETKGVGSRAVLEVRGRDVPFLLQDGQAAAKLVYEPLAGRPARLYGSEGSHYQSQGLQLSKHFAPWKG